MQDTSALTIEESHGKPRVTLRTPPALPAAPNDHAPDGRFVAGNSAHRKRVIKRAAKAGITTLNPSECQPWLRPWVEDSITYGRELAERFDDPLLARLAADAATARACYMSLLALAAAGDRDAMSEARGWLREHRSTMVSLSALAAQKPEDDPYEKGLAIVASIAAESESSDHPPRPAPTRTNRPGRQPRDVEITLSDGSTV